MDSYPHQYVAHNVPLVTLLGLETPAETEGADEEEHYPGFQQHGLTFSSDLPPIDGDAADALRQAFRDLDARDAAWNSRPGPGKMGSMAFTSRDVGRTLTLPPHKAQMPAQDQLEDLPSNWQTILHSPISPLTPSSKLYPDGILSPTWASKHQTLIPSAVICFFSFTVDESRSTLEDNALKTQINKFKEWKSSTKYACRMVVVLVCDEPAPVSAVVERLGNIRRSTNLDTKTLLYMPGGLSVDETRAYVGSLLSNIHPACIEYYRDLSKHARRKKNRASIPHPTLPPTFGTSQTLSARGWNVRYEVKLGIFAEFRGEMDAAERNYEQAYEDLMDGDVFESISSWSPRFNEGRMLADMLAIRILRCLLWTNQTTSAAQSWANHKYRMQEMVDKKGKGSNTYAWQAWEATWSTVMAQLIERVEIPYFQVPKPTAEAQLIIPNIFAHPERTLSKEALISPWDHLHHPGYWYARSAQRLQSRRVLATSISTEDRMPAGESPASALANRSHLYDTYMVPDPRGEYAEATSSDGLHSTLILEAYGRASMETAERNEVRRNERFRLEEAKELAKRGDWIAAAAVLRPFFEKCTYVQDSWWLLWQEVLLVATQIARNLKDGDLLLIVNWQLQSQWLDVPSQFRPDLESSISALDLPAAPSLSFNVDTTVPVLSTSFTFGHLNACVGDPLPCQLIVRSHHHSSPLTLSHIDISFSGSTQLTSIRISHSPDTPKYTGTAPNRPKLFQSITLQPSPSSSTTSTGHADLCIPPSSLHIYHFSLIPTETLALSASTIHSSLHTASFSLSIAQTLHEPRSGPLPWWTPSNTSTSPSTGNATFTRTPLYLPTYRTIAVQPRPPKLDLSFPAHRAVYYTDERALITIRTLNAESESADVRLKVRLTNPGLDAEVHWVDGKRESHVLVGETGMILPQRDLGELKAGEKAEVVFAIERLREMVEVGVEVEAVYTLGSKPGTVITKAVREGLGFVRPFEVGCESSDGVLPDVWPSYFALPEGRGPGGIAQRSYVTAKIVTCTKEEVVVERVELRQVEPNNTSVVCTTEAMDRQSEIEMKPDDEVARKFCVNVQKHDLDDRSQATAHLALAITWRRKSAISTSTSSSSDPLSSDSSPSTPSITTLISTPPLPFDFSKPRALASATLASIPSTNPPTPVINMTYILENPSDYMLTFGVTMDASDQFAFAGPKATSLQLTPFSRAEVRFTLLPLLRNAWIAPVVRVNDIGFKETLKVVAAEGVRGEKGRCLVWVP